MEYTHYQLPDRKRQSLTNSLPYTLDMGWLTSNSILTTGLYISVKVIFESVFKHAYKAIWLNLSRYFLDYSSGDSWLTWRW